MEKDDNKYISLEEFANKYGLRESTVRKNYKKIPGIAKKENGFLVLSGTRYPYNLRRTKLKDSADRRLVLLKSISEYKYISHKELRVEHKQFEAFLRDLLSAKLIKRNELSNHYGANAYDCTRLGDEFIQNKSKRMRQELMNLVAISAGKFVGVVVTTVYNEYK